MKDSVNLGKEIHGAAERDAIHIAVAPLIAGENLYPGDRIKLKIGTEDIAMGTRMDGDALAIVDPFLGGPVKPGNKFWALLFPGTITGLRHHWSHPDFSDGPIQHSELTAEAESELWLKQFAEKYHIDFDDMIENATRPGGDNYLVAHGIDLHSSADLIEGEETIFWLHLECYTGKKFSQDHRSNLRFSCSC